MKNIYLITFAILIHVLSTGKAFSQDFRLQQYISSAEKITARAETEKYYWVGSNHGLYCIRKKGDKVYHLTQENSILLSDTITSIATKSNGEVYIGTNKGIVRYDNYAFLLLTDENSPLRSNKITSLVCLNGTEIFAGTFDGGITIFSDLRNKTFTTKNASLSSLRETIKEWWA